MTDGLQIKGAEGNVTARVMVPQEAQEPFKWNVSAPLHCSPHDP